MRSKPASLLLLAGILGLSPLSAQEGAVSPTVPPPGNRADYEIRANLDGATKRLDGEETIRWTNGTGVATSELHFHLYLNAFSNNRSASAVERGSVHGEGEWGWQEVRSITVDGVDVAGSFEYLLADEGAAPEDRTVFRVTTPQPIAPGQTVGIAISWSSQLPRLRRRTGYSGDFLLVAQWFPKLGVFEGERGWNCHQFHASTEFFADFGAYRVTLDLPDEYENKVGATGVRVVSRKKDGNRVEVVFEAPSAEDQLRVDAQGRAPLVHDFTWTADPKYVVKEYQFKYDEWAAKSPAHQAEVERVQNALGPDVELRLRDVDVTVLIHPERRGQAQRHFEATANALFFYGLWFGEYPYEHVTVVDPGWGGRRAGGMEYPTLFTAGTQLFTSVEQHRPEGLIIHECGHQFWYGLVGNNEFEAAWLDEGINSYADSEALALAYGQRRRTTEYARLPIFEGERAAGLPDGGALGAALNGRRWAWHLESLDGIPVLESLSNHSIEPLRSSGIVDWWRDQPFTTLVSGWDDPRWNDRSRYLSNPNSGVIDHPSWASSDHQSYRANSYQRPAVALRSMIGVVGYDKFVAGMRNAATKWRYGHPYAQDFFDSFNEGAQEDLSWYFDDAFRSPKTIDWKVAVSQVPLSDPEGWFQGEDGVFRKYEPVEETRAEEVGAAGDGEEGEAPDGDPGEESTKPWTVEILLKREGELCLDLTCRVNFEDGEMRDIIWKREQQLAQSWLKLPFEASSKVTSVVLDPDRLYYFDRDMSDNQWYAEGDRVAPLRWTEKVLNQYGHLLHWYAGIGG